MTDAHFKMDGVNCWDVLAQKGYAIEPHLEGIKMEFDILYKGEKIAHLVHGGTNIITGKDYKLGNIPAPGIYKITCKESDIEGVFLCCFILGRSYDN